MTAAEELCRLLDKRGVKYWDMKTRGIWFGINADGSDHSYEAYDQTNSLIEIAAFDLTPEQAIAATLGRADARRYVGLRQGKCWERTEISEYYCGGCGWKVTDHDSYCPECGGALHKEPLGPWECREVMINRHWRGCSECGYVWENMYAAGFQTGPNYCPMCGRKVVDE